jgi:hypothetical protein
MSTQSGYPIFIEAGLSINARVDYFAKETGTNPQLGL